MSSPQRAYPQRHKLIVDASALIALFDESDQFHDEAVSFRDNFILTYQVSLFTTNYIYAEAMSHLTHLPDESLYEIERVIHQASTTPFYIQELWVDRNILERAMPIYFAYKSNDFSVTDCTTFVLMQDNRILAAFTFDDDYKIYVYREGNTKKSFWKLPEMLDSYLSLSRPQVRF